MPPQASIVRPVRWTGVILTFVPYALLFALFFWGLGFSDLTSLFASTFLFLGYRIVIVRFWLCADHRRGIAATRRGRFEDAIACFERSEAVWAARPTLDRYRALVLGSATPYTFSTLARYNRAYALSRLGRGQECLALLGEVLADDPSMLQARELRDILLAGSALHPEVGEAMTS